MRLVRDKTSLLASDLPAHRPHYSHGRMIFDSSLWTGIGAWEGLRLDPPLSWLLWRQWWWSIRKWARKRKFRCRVCGVQCDSSPADSGFWRTTAVCPDHCEDHDFEYEPSRREWCCVYCDKPAPHDFWAYHPD